MSEPSRDLVVLGGGPGGYTAAFRAADLGLSCAIVDDRPSLGGVCLHVGCIPSKALLHAAALLDETRTAGQIGLEFGVPDIDLNTLRHSTQRVIDRLADGLAGLAAARGIEVIGGRGRFAGPTQLTVDLAGGGVRMVPFRHAIIAVGSRPIEVPGLPDDPRIIDSTGALALEGIPEHLLVVGGGIIGLEMATVYHALGSAITVVEMADGLVPGADRDLVRPLQRRLAERYRALHLTTRLSGIEASPKHLKAYLDGPDGAQTVLADRILVAVGRRANGDRCGAEAAGVAVDEQGRIAVDPRLCTNVTHIHAIGDVTGGPMLAHRASHQGAVAAEAIAGQASIFDPAAIPSVAYTDPEIAWMGLTETEARAQGIDHRVAAVPWGANGRALTLGRGEGRTKLIVDPRSGRVLGAGMVGPNAGELIAAAVHAREMGADAEDLALTIHPHPTLSETLGLAAQVAAGTATDLPPRRRGSA